MSAFEPPRERAELPPVIAFADCTGFALQCTRVTDGELADVVDGFYELVATRVDAAGGRVVKYIGDAALMVFAPERIDDAVLGLCDVKTAADTYFAARAWDCRLDFSSRWRSACSRPDRAISKLSLPRWEHTFAPYRR